MLKLTKVPLVSKCKVDSEGLHLVEFLYVAHDDIIENFVRPQLHFLARIIRPAQLENGLETCICQL